MLIGKLDQNSRVSVKLATSKMEFLFFYSENATDIMECYNIYSIKEKKRQFLSQQNILSAPLALNPSDKSLAKKGTRFFFIDFIS